MLLQRGKVQKQLLVLKLLFPQSGKLQLLLELVCLRKVVLLLFGNLLSNLSAHSCMQRSQRAAMESRLELLQRT